MCRGGRERRDLSRLSRTSGRSVGLTYVQKLCNTCDVGEERGERGKMWVDEGKETREANAEEEREKERRTIQGATDLTFDFNLLFNSS